MRALGAAIGYLRSLVVTIPLIYVATIFWGTLSLAASVVDRGGRMQHGCARWWARTLLGVSLVRVRVRGQEHLATVRGKPCVFAANHQSYMDIPVAFAHLPVNFRIMAKASLFGIPFLGWHLRRAGHLPIARDNPRQAARSLLEAAKHIREGMPVFVFPEGGRTPDGKLQEFKAGTFLLAIRSGAPVVPVTLNGTRAVLKMNSWHIHAGRAEMILHAPIATEGMRSEDAERLSGEVRGVIAGDFEEERARGVE